MPGIVTHGSVARSEIATTIRDLIDTGPGPGRLRVQAQSGLVLGDIPLNEPCGSISGATIVFDLTSDPEDSSADNTGVIAKADIINGDGAVIIAGSAGITGAGHAFELDTLNVNQGDIIPLKFASYTAPT